MFVTNTVRDEQRSCQPARISLQMPRVSPRSQPAKAPLSRDAVLAAALRVLRTKGVDGVTMRAVAAELETGAASLYVYVKDRRDLLNQMFDRVVGEIDFDEPPDPVRWRDQLERLAFRILRMYERYPGIARVPLANIPTGPNAVRGADRMIALMRAGGVDDRKIAWFIDIVSLFICATGYESAIYLEQGRDEDEAIDELRDAYGQIDPGAYPDFVSMLPLLTQGDGDERFAFGLRLLIEGLVHADPPDIAPSW